jgi:hypothetical protein
MVEFVAVVVSPRSGLVMRSLVVVSSSRLVHKKKMGGSTLNDAPGQEVVEHQGIVTMNQTKREKFRRECTRGTSNYYYFRRL